MMVCPTEVAHDLVDVSRNYSSLGPWKHVQDQCCTFSSYSLRSRISTILNPVPHPFLIPLLRPLLLLFIHCPCLLSLSLKPPLLLKRPMIALLRMFRLMLLQKHPSLLPRTLLPPKRMIMMRSLWLLFSSFIFLSLRILFYLLSLMSRFEIFRHLPLRTSILRGMLSSDLVGFHTYSNARHFVSSVKRHLGVYSSLLNVYCSCRHPEL